MGRTSVKLVAAMSQARWFIRFHRRSVWLVPQVDDYKLSVVKPLPDDLPVGTAAILIDTDESILETVVARS